MKEPERWLELGILTLLATIVAGGGIAIAGQAAQSAARRRRHALPAPDAGSMPNHAHRNIASPAAR